MKYQFQFAGIDFNRPSSSPRKWRRTGLLIAAFLLAGLAYWKYLHFLAHKPVTAVAHVAAAMPSVASAKPTEISTQLPPALKQAADVGVATLVTHLFESVKLPTVATPPSQTIAADPAPAPTEVVPVSVAANPVTHVAPKPKLRHLLTLTPELRLQRAAQVALENMLDQANKFPDAYGFGPTDVFTQAKLGEAIPIYAIAETDRAGYQSGQPVKPLLKPANQWMFPVLVGQHICCMVRVNYSGHDYVPGDSSKSLGMAWAKITDKWPAEDGFHPQLIVNPEVPGFFFTIPELPTPNVTDTDQMLFFHADLSPADVILASWR